jgi:hypothetical protein
MRFPSVFSLLIAAIVVGESSACSAGCVPYKAELSNAVFSPIGMVTAADKATTIKLCDNYGCATRSIAAWPRPSTPPSEVLPTLIIPHDASANSIRNLVAFVLRGAKVIRVASAPPVLAIPGGATGSDTSCASESGRLVVRYNARTKKLYRN